MGEDGGDGDFGIVAMDGDVDVGQAVVVAARVVEGGEGFGIARQGAVGGLGDAALHGIEGAVEPDGDAVVLQQQAIAGQGESAATERQDGGAAAFDPTNVLGDDGVLDAAEFGLAASGEEVGDGGLFGGLDLRIGIEETPAHAMGEMTSHGALAGSHEADHVNAGGALQGEVHAVRLMAAMRASTMEGNRRMASTKSQSEEHTSELQSL